MLSAAMECMMQSLLHNGSCGNSTFSMLHCTAACKKSKDQTLAGPAAVSLTWAPNVRLFASPQLARSATGDLRPRFPQNCKKCQQGCPVANMTPVLSNRHQLQGPSDVYLQRHNSAKCDVHIECITACAAHFGLVLPNSTSPRSQL
jgi:hypothetical protein